MRYSLFVQRPFFSILLSASMWVCLEKARAADENTNVPISDQSNGNNHWNSSINVQPIASLRQASVAGDIRSNDWTDGKKLENEPSDVQSVAPKESVLEIGGGKLADGSSIATKPNSGQTAGAFPAQANNPPSRPALASNGNVQWDGTQGTEWTDQQNWQGGSAPSSNDNVVFDNGKAVSIGSGKSASYNTLDMGYDSGGQGLTIDTGGTLNGTEATIGSGANKVGSATVSGTWTNSGSLTIGANGGNGTLNIQNGTVKLGDDDGDLTIGDGIGSTGKVTIDGDNAKLTVDDLSVGKAGGDGTLEIKGGIVDSGNGVDIGALSKDSHGKVELDGGILKAKRITGAENDNSEFVFNGGTLQANIDTKSLLGFFTGSNLKLGENGGTVDTNGFKVGISSTLSGIGNFHVMNGDQTKAGILTFYTPATYSGTTFISENATLAQGIANGFSKESTVNIAQGGTLDLGGYDGQIGGLNGVAGSKVTGGGESGTTNFSVGANNDSGNFSGEITDGPDGGKLKFTKVGTGTQIFTGTANYTGGTEVKEGKLIGTTDSLKNDIANEAALEFAQDKDGTFHGQITGSGTVIINTANIDNKIIFDTDQTYTGDTIIDKGTLAENAKFSSTNVMVNSEGVLSGTGTVEGNVTVNAGGWMKPGNDSIAAGGMRVHSTGTFHIGGDYTQDKDGGVEFNIAGLNQYDSLDIQGKAMLGGTIHGAEANHFIPPDKSEYHVIHADGGRIGKFDTENIDTPLKLKVDYRGDDDVYLIAEQGDFVPISDLTPATQSLNNALLDLIPAAKGPLQNVLADLDQTPKDSIMDYLDQLTPKGMLEIKEILFNNTNTQYGQITERLAAARAGVDGISLNGLSQEPMEQQRYRHEETLHDKDGREVAYQYQTPGDFSKDQGRSTLSLFATASGIFSKINTAQDLPTMNSTTGNFSAGVDCRMFDHFDIGLFCGYEGTRTNFADGTWMRSNGIRFGGYGTAHWNGFYLNAIAGSGLHSIGLNRVIAINEGDRWAARGNPPASELDSLLGGGYEYSLGKWRFGADASCQYTYLGIGGYQETGADTLDLKVGGQHPGSLMSTVGVNVSYNWAITPDIKLVPTMGISWQHQFLDYSDNIYSSFYGGRGPSFFFPSAKGERDDIYGMAGFSLQIGHHFGLFAFYNPIFGGREVLSHGILTGLNFTF